MQFMIRPLLALERLFERLATRLAQPGATGRAFIVVPLLFGVLSVLLGQDVNWDLRNYHWYNAHALLHGRIELDIAPGQWQSYFNPLIDVPYYLLNQALPAMVVGFIFGYVHGLNFILLTAIATQLFKPAADTARLPLLLALAGTCGAGFLSQLGNTMGDNLTALLVLGALYLVLRRWQAMGEQVKPSLPTLLISGLLMGLASGLKLTNAPYAVALCATLLMLPASWPQRLMAAFAHGCAVLVGISITAGYWWLAMWERFGNPLFPQFNNIFRSPLAQQLGVIDNYHMPHGVLEALFWPLVFMVQTSRVSEIPLKMVIVPVLYVLAVLWLLRWLVARIKRQNAMAPLTGQQRALLVFGLVAYLVWAKLFGIYRYLIPLELLAPIMAWLLVQQLMPATHGPRVAGWLVALCCLAVFPFVSWGHAGWATQAFRVTVPELAQPDNTIVFTAHGDPPMGWMAPAFPSQVRVIALAGGFPESPAWRARIAAAVSERPGPHYVMLAAARSDKENTLERKRALVGMLGLTASEQDCARLTRWLARTRQKVEVVASDAPGQACTLSVPQHLMAELPQRDQQIMATAQQGLAGYGLRIDEGSCKTYAAAVGTSPYPYRWCRVDVVQAAR